MGSRRKFYVNLILTRSNPFKEGINLAEYKLEDEKSFIREFFSQKNDQRLWIVSNNICDTIFTSYKLLSHFHIYFDPQTNIPHPHFYVLLPSSKEILKEKIQVNVAGHEWILRRTSKILATPRDEIGKIIFEGIVRRVIRFALKRTKKFEKVGRKFINIFSSTREKNGIIKREGIVFDVEIFDNGYVGLWIDVTFQLTQPIYDLIYRNGRLVDNFKEILEALKADGRTVYARSMKKKTWSIGKIKEIKVEPASKVKFKGKDITVYEYWKTNIEPQGYYIDPQTSPIVVLEKDGEETYWPIFCKVKSRNNKEKIKPLLFLNPLEVGDVTPPYLPPKDRFEKILQYSKKISNAVRNFLDVHNIDLSLDFDPLLRDLQYLKDRGFIEDFGYLKGWNRNLGPELLFYGGMKEKKIKFGIKKHGPIMGNWEINCVIIHPDMVNEKDIEVFKQKFNSCANFARLRIIDTIRVEVNNSKFHQITWRYLRATTDAIEKIEKEDKPRCLIVILPPKKRKEWYYIIRKSSYSKDLIPQCIRLETFKKIIVSNTENVENIILNLALSIYYNSLQDIFLEWFDEGTAPEGISWILFNPAGYWYDKNNLSIFMGFDASRHPEYQSKYGVSITLCDNRGRLLYTHPQQTDDYLQLNVLKNIFRVIFDKLRKLPYYTKIKRMVFYRDGKIRPRELINISRAIDEIIEMLKEEGEIKEFKVDIISVPKTGEERVFVVNGSHVENVMAGFYTILNKKDAIIVTSKLHPKMSKRVTVKPLRITYEVCVPEKDNRTNFQLILAEFADLTMLDWASALTQPKLPLPLLLAHNTSKTMAATQGEIVRDGKVHV